MDSNPRSPVIGTMVFALASPSRPQEALQRLVDAGLEPTRLRPIVRTRPCSVFGRPVHLGIAPVDYDPVVLLKPFGPRLAADALPSEDSPMAAPGQPIRVPAFAVVPH